MEQTELIPHLFRSEFSRITAVLCKGFGISHLEEAEDLASEVFLSAIETWPYRGIPENPTAWLLQVAKNKAKNYLRRKSVFSGSVSGSLRNTSISYIEHDIDLSAQNISDSQLQMLFAICHPVLPAESQIGLSLRILCGFGLEEIANAFLTSKETISKRLYRAREKLRNERIPIEFPQAGEINMRLDTVLTTLYLLFNEGYYSESRANIIRKDLCLEAMRLTNLLAENHGTNLPRVKALLSLMCFHSSRLDARSDAEGWLILYEDQDESRWSTALIAKGVYFLHESATGKSISKYHLEATIAYWHTCKQDTAGKWEKILHTYNQLLMLEYSPIAALNRTYALSKVHGKAFAINEAQKLQLTRNQFYYALLGELYTDLDNDQARINFAKAIQLAKRHADKNTLQKKVSRLNT